LVGENDCCFAKGIEFIKFQFCGSICSYGLKIKILWLLLQINLIKRIKKKFIVINSNTHFRLFSKGFPSSKGLKSKNAINAI
jgi:hypothetical protein